MVLTDALGIMGLKGWRTGQDKDESWCVLACL
jgi:hypothetical protein